MNDPDPDPDFQLEEELLEAVPRRVVATRGALLAWRWGWNLLLAIVCIITLLGSGEMNDLKNLALHSCFIDGYVIAAKSSSNSNGGGCEVTYTLQRNSAVSAGTFDLPDWTGSLPKAGDTFEVTYLPQTPSVYRLGKVRPNALEDCDSHWIAVGLWCVVPYVLLMWFVKCYENTRK